MLNRMALAGAVAAVFLSSLIVSGSVFAAGDVNEQECPTATESSPGFRNYLPDCRAYEMVTPPYKDGNGNMHVQAISSEGSRVIVSSLSAFAGTESDPIDGGSGAVYQFARSGSGWVVSSATPPTSLTPNAHLFGVSADATATMWEVLGQSRSIYSTMLDVREPSGSFVEVGPLIPPGGATGPPADNHGGDNEEVGFAGASDDLSRMLFTIRAEHPEFLWPGDTTQPETNHKSLYEYVGVENKRPMLVGVNDVGDLISNCGVDVGYTGPNLDGGQDSYNAVSANGETVFFTPEGHENSGCKPATEAPEVDELYARVGQIQTVAISEPSFAQCIFCRTGVPTLKEPATTEKRSIFQGASQDGSKAFFLTEQELLAGNVGPNIYEYDFDNPVGEKIVRVSGGSPGHESSDPEVQGVARVSEDGSHVYFVAKGVLAGMNAEKKSPAQGANNLYVFERDSVYPSGHTIFVATLSSETKVELGTDEAPCMVLSGEEKEECERPFIREFQERNGADARDWNQEDHRPLQATPEGRFLVFESSADLAGNTSGLQQVFEYDAQEERLVRVSVGAAGYASGVANAEVHSSSIQSQSYSGVSAPTDSTTDLAVSADGSRVLFYSSGGLTEGSEADTVNVYEYRSEGSSGSIANGNVYLIGTNAASPEAIGLDASGIDAFFLTADPLVPADVDTQVDIYDAREDGGFLAPIVAAACASEACQGTPSSARVFGLPASAGVMGSDNLTAPPADAQQPPGQITTTPKPEKCKKDFTKKHGRCVKIKEKKSKAKKLTGASKGREVNRRKGSK